MRYIKKSGKRWLMLITLLLANIASAAQPITLSFGVVPQEGPLRTVNLWSDLLKEIERRSGYHIKLEPVQDIHTFEQKLTAGQFDLVYMNPYEYTVYHRVSGYQAFARENGQLQGLIVVRSSSAIQKLSDLQGQTIAFVPNAFAATMLPLTYLHQQGISVVPKYLDSHDSVYLAVLNKMYPAGGGVRGTLARMVPELRSELRVLWAAPPVTTHAIAGHPRVPHAVIEKLQHVLIDLKSDSTGRKILRAQGFKDIIVAHDRDWNDVRALYPSNF